LQDPEGCQGIAHDPVLRQGRALERAGRHLPEHPRPEGPRGGHDRFRPDPRFADRRTRRAVRYRPGLHARSVKSRVQESTLVPQRTHALVLAACATLGLGGAGTSLPAAGPPPEKTTLFTAGEQGYKLFRIPGLVVSPRGTLLAYCEARRSD